MLAGSAFAREGLVLTQHAWQVTPITILAMCFLGLALVAFFVGKARSRQWLTAVDYIHDAPVLRSFYDWSEKRYFDIYEQGVRFITWLAHIVFQGIERSADWVIECFARVFVAVGEGVRKAQTGLLAMYVSWLVFGLVILLLLVGGVFK